MITSISKSKLITMVETERKIICNILKENEVGCDKIYSIIQNRPMPNILKSHRKKQKTDEPKKKTGYILFSQDIRKKSNDISSKDCVRAAGDAWRKMDTKEKENWDMKANEQFEKDISEYKKVHPEYKQLPSKIHIPRIKNGYSIFLSEVIKSPNKQITGTESRQNIGILWKELSPKDRRVYEVKANEQTEEALKFKQFTKHITSELLNAGVSDNITSLEREAAKMWYNMSFEEKNVYKKKTNNVKNEEKMSIPSKKSAFQYFVKKCKEENPENLNIVSYSSVKWKNMTKDEKQPFILKSEDSKNKYLEFETYLKENKNMLLSTIYNDYGKAYDNKSDNAKLNILEKTAAKTWNPKSNRKDDQNNQIMKER